MLRGPPAARAGSRAASLRWTHARPPIWTATAGSIWSAAAATATRATAKSDRQKPYRWQALRPHAATATGDQRINSFGIGGEVEVRTGLHVQKQLIAAPVVHVGLGTARTQRSGPHRLAERHAAVGVRPRRRTRPIAATQRLKGSCPWLFAWNGREMAFVTDLLWRSPLGLRINAQDTADVLTTEDWVKHPRRPAAAA